MSTAVSPVVRISKPRLSLLILESALAAVAAVLLAWLLLWFIRQRSRDLRVEAFYVAPSAATASRAPFLASDVRILRGGAPGDDPAPVNPDGLADAILEVVSRPDAAAVVFVSAPVVGKGPDAMIGSVSIRSLIESVVKGARRDVLLALDLAQIDSDRDLGIYGNCPYEGLSAAVSAMTPGERCVYVMTGSAPAQKSWGADGLGQSAFAHYLGKGLSGEARGWDVPEVFGQVSVEGLYHYVHRHVSQWAKSQRDAVQTPLLMKIGDNSRAVTLSYRKPVKTEPPATAAKAAAISEAAPEPPKAAASKKDEAPPEAEKVGARAESPASSPKDRLLGDLLEEWKQHDVLGKQRPYHVLPENWRMYESDLMRVERRLRSAWTGSGSIEAVRKELEEVVRRRGELQARLKLTRDAENSFPLRPARGSEEGKRAVTDALIYLTGGGPDDDELYSAPPIPKASPEPAKDAGSPRNDPPRTLVDALFGGFPEPFLELQAAAWALRFGQEFSVPEYFKQGRRGPALRRLVQARARAEVALSQDRRGLDWIRPIVNLGDERRRTAQDRLVDPAFSTEEAERRFKGEVGQFERNYESAFVIGQEVRDARRIWERVAAELPELAEWALRSGLAARNAQGLPADPLPPPVTRALGAASALIEALDRAAPQDQGPGFLEQIQKPADDLRAASRNALAALDELEKQLLNIVRTDGARDWIALDAALRTPLAPAEDRRRLLKSILALGDQLKLEADASTPDAAEQIPDPGFWRLAAGLAQLDQELSRIARKDRAEVDTAAILREAWTAVETAPTAPETVAKTTALLKQYETEATKERVRASAARSERRRDTERKATDVGVALRLDDRAVRLLCEGAIGREDPPLDGAPQSWENFARYETLLFHIERLRQDFAPNSASLRRLADELAVPLGIADARDRSRAAPMLRIVTRPPASSSLKIDEDGKASLAVGVAPPEESAARSEPLPRGTAFIGLATPPSGLRIEAEDGTPPTAPPGGLREVGASAPEARPVTFTVRQADLRSNATAFKVAAKIYYRGRVDEVGTAVVDVIPKEFPSLVLASVSQDPRDLETRFGKGAAERIEDQFKLHPGEGYMHEGKDAAYLLTLKNVTFQKLTVGYQRTLRDPGNAAQPKLIDDAEKLSVLAPGESVRIAGKVTSAETPKGQVRELKVAMSVKESKEPVPDLIVKFRQIDHTQYMNIDPFIGPARFEDVVQPCYAVRFTRKIDDPVREPIKSNELSCTINGVTGRNGGDYELLPGQSIITTQPFVPGKNQFTWSGKIENEVLRPTQSQ